MKNANIKRHLKRVRALLSEATSAQSGEEFQRVILQRFYGLEAAIAKEVEELERRADEQALRLWEYKR